MPFFRRKIKTCYRHKGYFIEILCMKFQRYLLLHFARVEDHEKCIVVMRICVCVCLSVCPRPHAYSIAGTRM